jgi:TolB protein
MGRGFAWVTALVLALLVCVPLSAQEGEGDIDIDIRGAIKRTLIPIALTPVGGGEVGKEIMEVLRRDLQLSGYFTLLPPDSFFFDVGADGMSSSTINFENWYNVGASGVIKGAFKEAGGQIKLDMRLFLVERGIQAKLNWKPSTVDRVSLRREVHEFANAVIEFYTGNRGIFGSRITFAARARNGEKHIYVMDVDGAALKRITEGSGINILPSFGAGGVYYTSYKRGNPDLYFSKRGQPPRLVSSQPGQNSGASFCKGKVAVTLSRGGSNTDIYLIHPLTGAIQARLTDHWGIDTSPSWSPDCSKLAFVSDRAGTPQIYVMNADGTDQRRLTFKGRYNTSPDWSPKGDKIAFCARDERNAYDIFTVDLGGFIERLTQNQGSNEEPSFSPDGNYIVFISSRGGVGLRIYIMTADGQSQHLITCQGGGFSTPNWGGRR